MIKERRWFTSDERIVLEGAMSQLKRRRFSEWDGMLFWVREYPKAVQHLVLAATYHYSEWLNAVLVFNTEPQQEGVEPEFYVIAEHKKGRVRYWLPVSPNLMEGTEKLMPLIKRSVLPWWRHFSLDTYLFYAAYVVIMAGTILFILHHGPGWGSASLLFLFGSVVIGGFWVFVRHCLNRRKRLAAMRELLPPEPKATQPVEPKLPDWLHQTASGSAQIS